MCDKKESSDDLLNTRFNVYVKMKATDYERQVLENDIANWSKVIDESTGMPLITPKDAFKIRNIDDPKLAEMYLTHITDDKMRKAQADKAQREAANLKSQQDTAKQTAEAAKQLEEQKENFEISKLGAASKGKKEEILLEGMMEIYKTILAPKTAAPGSPLPQNPTLPQELQKLFGMISANVAMPMLMENAAMQQQAQQGPQEEQAEGTEEPPQQEEQEGQQMMQ